MSPLYTKDNLIHSRLLENNFTAYHFRLDSADIFRISCDKTIAFVLRTALIMTRIASSDVIDKFAICPVFIFAFVNNYTEIITGNIFLIFKRCFIILC